MQLYEKNLKTNSSTKKRNIKKERKGKNEKRKTQADKESAIVIMDIEKCINKAN